MGDNEDTEGDKMTDKIMSLVCSTLKRTRLYQVLTAGQSQESPALGVRKRDISSTSVRTLTREKKR